MEAEKEDMKCGLIIVNFNEYPVTEELLARIKDAPEIDHIVIVDNASTDDSFAQLSKYQNDRITLLQSGRDGGYSFGNNVGARYLIEHHNPDIIGIANPDTAFDGSFAGKVKEVFAAEPDYAVLTGIQLTPSGETGEHPFWRDEGTATAMFRQLLRETFGRTASLKDSGYIESIRRSPRELNEVWAVEGSLFFIRREDFEAAGLFDDSVFMYYEEHILASKLAKCGRKTGIINTITFVHNHRPPKDNSLEARYRRGMNSLKSREEASTYYFRTYVTHNHALWAVYSFLMKLRRLKTRLAYSARYVKKYFTASNPSR